MKNARRKVDSQIQDLKFPIAILALAVAGVLSGCSGVNGDNATSSADRITEPHLELKIVDTTGSTAAKPSSGNVESQAISTVTSSIGVMYLESQLAPLSVLGTQLQASEIAIKGANVYIGYNAVDKNGVVIKKGSVELLSPLACDNPLTITRTEYCTKSLGRIDFPNTDIFGIHSDGTNLFAVGSTDDESQAPKFARLYKIGLNSTTKIPTSILSTVALPSYAGTSVISTGSNLLVTTGTSTDTARMGGLSVVNPTTMAVTASQSLYDARAVAVASNSSTTAFVTRGKVDSSNAGAVVEYNVNGSGSALRTLNTGGNTIAESKSSIQVGNELLLVSTGDQGFKVLCKATGATLLTKAAPVVSNIPAARTVTNSVTAAPGYIFAANGEAGLYVYKFKKSNVGNTNYCQGVTATLLGRLALDSDDSDVTYINGELSANSVNYVPIFNLLNIVTAKLIVVASGNKGVSLINITNLNTSVSDDVDDFN